MNIIVLYIYVLTLYYRIILIFSYMGVVIHYIHVMPMVYICTYSNLRLYIYILLYELSIIYLYALTYNNIYNLFLYIILVYLILCLHLILIY